MMVVSAAWWEMWLDKGSQAACLSSISSVGQSPPVPLHHGRVAPQAAVTIIANIAAWVFSVFGFRHFDVMHMLNLFSLSLHFLCIVACRPQLKAPMGELPCELADWPAFFVLVSYSRLVFELLEVSRRHLGFAISLLRSSAAAAFLHVRVDCHGDGNGDGEAIAADLERNHAWSRV